MDDREMLELAAKAAGQERSAAGDLWSNARGRLWNPLTDDGDALRLAATLKLDIEWRNDGRVEAYLNVANNKDDLRFSACIESTRDGDNNAAVRRAIVRAAAEIGKAMK